MQDQHLMARTLIHDHTISLDELYVQWWANGGWPGEAKLGSLIDGAWALRESDLAVLGWALGDLTDLLALHPFPRRRA